MKYWKAIRENTDYIGRQLNGLLISEYSRSNEYIVGFPIAILHTAEGTRFDVVGLLQIDFNDGSRDAYYIVNEPTASSMVNPFFVHAGEGRLKKGDDLENNLIEIFSHFGSKFKQKTGTMPVAIGLLPAIKNGTGITSKPDSTQKKETSTTLTITDYKKMWKSLVKEQQSNEKRRNVHPFFEILRGILLEIIEKQIQNIAKKEITDVFKTENELVLLKDGEKLIREVNKTLREISKLAKECNAANEAKNYNDSQLISRRNEMLHVLNPQVSWSTFPKVQNSEEQTMLASMMLSKEKNIKWKKVGDFLAAQATVATYSIMNDKLLINDALQLTAAWGGVFKGVYYPDVEEVLSSSIGSRIQRYR